jgi:hypothetical protein
VQAKTGLCGTKLAQPVRQRFTALARFGALAATSGAAWLWASHQYPGTMHQVPVHAAVRYRRAGWVRTRS